MEANSKQLTSTAKKAARDAEIISQIAGHARINHCHIFCSFWRNAKKNFHDFAENSGFSISSDFLSGMLERYSLLYSDDCLLKLGVNEQSSFDQILPAAFLLAERLGHEFVGVEHIIYGCIISNENFADFLLKQDIDTEHLKSCLKKFIEGKHLIASDGMDGSEEDDDDSDGDPNESPLEKYCINFNDLVRSNNFPPIFVRQDVVKQIEETLFRKTKSNCILLGEAGVGKTSVVESLAQFIQEEDYNGPLKGFFVYALDLAKMLAGTQLRGQFEKRFKVLLEVLANHDNVILFIDEAHAIIGAGSREGSFDLANMLKPALARGAIKCIAATTQDEYRKHIEKDPALSRRFQPVFIPEPNEKEVAHMIKFALPSYQEHHKLTVSDDLISKLVRLASIYLVGKKFPDKGFDILDQAMAYCRLNSEKDKLSINDVVHVVSIKTGISKKTILETLNFQFNSFEEEVRKEVYGQDAAIKKVFDTLVCAKAGLRNFKKPLASLLFVGPTGVGKTHLAKMIAKEYFGNEQNLLQLNLTEFTDSGAVSQLIGASSGYIGHDQGGLLTNFVNRRPNSVVLFDEADKCHRNVLNLLLQIMDEGKVTSGHGIDIDFSQTIIILTSNGFSQPKPAIGFIDSKEDMYQESIKDFLPPEFISRVDEIISFNLLNKESLKFVVANELKKLQENISPKLEIDLDVYDFLVEKTENAREASNVVKKNIIIPIAKNIVANGKLKQVSIKVVDKNINLEYH